MKPTIIFVYNARAGTLYKTLDLAHKILSPATYPCQLCNLTYGNFTIRSNWKHFLQNQDLDTEFYYLQEWQTSNHYFPVALPAILWQKTKAAKPEILISKPELQQMATSEDLIALLKARLSVVSQGP